MFLPAFADRIASIPRIAIRPGLIVAFLSLIPLLNVAFRPLYFRCSAAVPPLLSRCFRDAKIRE